MKGHTVVTCIAPGGRISLVRERLDLSGHLADVYMAAWKQSRLGGGQMALQRSLSKVCDRPGPALNTAQQDSGALIQMMPLTCHITVP